MSITFNLGICPDCGAEHNPEIVPFLLMSGWIQMEESTEETPVVGLNPLLIDALFRCNAAGETIGAIEEMLFNDCVDVFLDMENDENGNDDNKEHFKPVLSIVKTDD